MRIPTMILMCGSSGKPLSWPQRADVGLVEGVCARPSQKFGRNREVGHVQLHIDYFRSDAALYQNHLWHPLSDVKEVAWANPWRSEISWYLLSMQARYHSYCLIFLPKVFSGYLHAFLGVVGYLVDEYMCMSESTSLDSMHKFCRAGVRRCARERAKYGHSMTIAHQWEEGFSWYA
jgi:hypothetical protein